MILCDRNVLYLLNVNPIDYMNAIFWDIFLSI